MLIRAGARILASRLELVSQLEPKIASASQRISANSMPLVLRYRASGGPIDDLSDALESGREVLRLQFLRGNPARVRETFVRIAARAEAA